MAFSTSDLPVGEPSLHWQEPDPWRYLIRVNSRTSRSDCAECDHFLGDEASGVYCNLQRWMQGCLMPNPGLGEACGLASYPDVDTEKPRCQPHVDYANSRVGLDRDDLRRVEPFTKRAA